MVPVAHKRAVGARRPGDKSLDTIARTDARYGSDPFFKGPRGWPYWSLLECRKPIQNPNLWPDTQSTFFLARFAMPPGSALTLRRPFPRARNFKRALYKAQSGTRVSLGDDLAGPDIAPDPGSANPFVVGADRRAALRDYTVTILAQDPPPAGAARPPNTLHGGTDGGDRQLALRI